MFKRDIATKWEAENLKRLRDAPHANYDLTPNGLEFSRAKYDLQRWRERRIDHLEIRLAIASHVLRRDFDRER